MGHLKEMTRNVLVALREFPGESSLPGRGHDPIELLTPLLEELSKLDPTDFDPSVQAQFVTLRSNLGYQLVPERKHDGNLRHDLCRLYEVVDLYYAPSAGDAPRDFSFVLDERFREIVGRDYEELKRNAYPSKSWKSTVILSGSILEAVLYDRLARDEPSARAAMAAASAPKRKGAAKDIRSDERTEEWKLDDLIKVAGEIGVLPAETVQTIHQTLREYRNLVHPKAEIRKPVPLSAGYARSSFGMLDVVLDILAAETRAQ